MTIKITPGNERLFVCCRKSSQSVQLLRLVSRMRPRRRFLQNIVGIVRPKEAPSLPKEVCTASQWLHAYSNIRLSKIETRIDPAMPRPFEKKKNISYQHGAWS